MDDNYKELTYEEALEFYNRWGRTILVGNSPTDYYEFNKIKDKRSLDDCIKQYLNYYDGPVRFFLDQRTIDHDMELKYKNESKNMDKKLIRLTESDLHRIVKESVHKILKETSEYYDSNLDEGVYLSAGWLSDLLEKMYKVESDTALGIHIALGIIMDHI